MYGQIDLGQQNKQWESVDSGSVAIIVVSLYTDDKSVYA